MARSTCLRWLSAATALGLAGCTNRVVVMDSRHPEAGTLRTSPWSVRSAGPRMGVVYFTGDAADGLEKGYGIGPALGAWGWQFEFQYDIEGADVTALLEVVPLALGMEAGEFFPSGSALVGLRNGSGWEFGVGPNFSESGVGIVGAIGKTYQLGTLNIPINLGAVSNEDGMRYSITLGGNLEQ